MLRNLFFLWFLIFALFCTSIVSSTEHKLLKSESDNKNRIISLLKSQELNTQLSAGDPKQQAIKDGKEAVANVTKALNRTKTALKEVEEIKQNIEEEIKQIKAVNTSKGKKVNITEELVTAENALWFCVSAIRAIKIEIKEMEALETAVKNLNNMIPFNRRSSPKTMAQKTVNLAKNAEVSMLNCELAANNTRKALEDAKSAKIRAQEKANKPKETSLPATNSNNEGQTTSSNSPVNQAEKTARNADNSSSTAVSPSNTSNNNEKENTVHKSSQKESTKTNNKNNGTTNESVKVNNLSDIKNDGSFILKWLCSESLLLLAVLSIYFN